MSDIKLLPCPFCGSGDTFVEQNNSVSCFVQCDTCGCQGPSGMLRSTTEDEEMPGRPVAVERWNAYVHTSACAAGHYRLEALWSLINDYLGERREGNDAGPAARQLDEALGRLVGATPSADSGEVALWWSKVNTEARALADGQDASDLLAAVEGLVHAYRAAQPPAPAQAGPSDEEIAALFTEARSRVTGDEAQQRWIVRALLSRSGRLPVAAPSDADLDALWDEAHEPYGANDDFELGRRAYARLVLSRYGGAAGEPVAWLVKSKRGLIRAAWTAPPDADQIAVARHDGDTITPLYAAPQPHAVPAGVERWPEDWRRWGFNGAIRVAAEALRYLADNPRPSGGEARFNAAHLLQTARELETTQGVLLAAQLGPQGLACAGVQQRFVEHHRRLASVPQYVRAAVKALGKTVRRCDAKGSPAAEEVGPTALPPTMKALEGPKP